jgi:hypothetical protein
MGLVELVFGVRLTGWWDGVGVVSGGGLLVGWLDIDATVCQPLFGVDGCAVDLDLEV